MIPRQVFADVTVPFLFHLGCWSIVNLISTHWNWTTFSGWQRDIVHSSHGPIPQMATDSDTKKRRIGGHEILSPSSATHHWYQSLELVVMTNSKSFLVAKIEPDCTGRIFIFLGHSQAQRRFRWISTFSKVWDEHNLRTRRPGLTSTKRRMIFEVITKEQGQRVSSTLPWICLKCRKCPWSHSSMCVCACGQEDVLFPSSCSRSVVIL